MKNVIFRLVIILSMAQTSFSQNGQMVETTSSLQAENKKAVSLIEADRLNELALKSYREKQFEQALLYAKQTLGIREQLLPHNHPLVAESLSSLGSVYFALQKYSEADTYLHRALSLYEVIYGEESLKLGQLLSLLAENQLALGRHNKAVKTLERALLIREKRLGPDHLEVARTLIRICELRASESFSACRRAIIILEKIPASDSNQVIQLIQNCACAVIPSINFKEASNYWSRLDKKENPNQPTTIVWIEDLESKASKKVSPLYKRASIPPGTSYDLFVKVEINEMGKVTQTKLLCGWPAFEASAIEAARQWQFHLMRINGKPIQFQGVLAFKFKSLIPVRVE